MTQQNVHVLLVLMSELDIKLGPTTATQTEIKNSSAAKPETASPPRLIVSVLLIPATLSLLSSRHISITLIIPQ